MADGAPSAAGENVKGAATVENSLLTSKHTQLSEESAPEKGKHIHTKTCTQILVTAWLLRAKTWKPSKHPSTDGGQTKAAREEGDTGAEPAPAGGGLETVRLRDRNRPRETTRRVSLPPRDVQV